LILKKEVWYLNKLREVILMHHLRINGVSDSRRLYFLHWKLNYKFSALAELAIDFYVTAV
jgi:hypothetical protein